MIFLAHAREDAVEARQLILELESAGLPCFISPDLPQGDAFWRDALAERLAYCRLAVYLQSSAAEASPWVQQERRWCDVHSKLIVVNARGDADAVRRINARYGGVGRLDGSRHAVYYDSAVDIRKSRLLLNEEGRSLLARMASRSTCWGAMHVDGQRAWLADGRIELIRIPGSSGGQYLAIHPITNALYREFLKAMPEVSPPPTWARTSWIEDNIPVTGITWYEALACAIWYGGKLPTEASWYWAALGGAQHRRYATVDGSLTDQTAHFGVAFGEGMPVPTGTYQATEEGFDGLCGNTWDWCSDIDGPFRSIRGGGWMDDETFCRTDSRYRHAPIDRDACVGVRLALDVSDVVC